MRIFQLGAIASVLALAPFAAADTIALAPTTPDGGQEYDALFGMDFNTNQSIKVTQLGVFDNHADGVLNTDSPTQPIVIQLWDLNNPATPLAQLNFGGGSPVGTDTSVGSGMVFFQNLATPLILPAGGNYYISEDYSGAEQFFNSGGNVATAPTINDGGGLITFVGGGRASNGHDYVYPSGGGGFIDGGPPNRYAGPNFAFTSTPEPASLGLVGVGAISLLARRRRA